MTQNQQTNQDQNRQQPQQDKDGQQQQKGGDTQRQQNGEKDREGGQQDGQSRNNQAGR